ncbi:MAG: hypothetical protein H8M99_07430 [Gloeobacteraceae cyanobacterium ES-bin-144]|nr:hypothetical protein [Verrucomicrobiales bacterium]
MTPIPPSSPDESSIPKKNRLTLGDLPKESTELDLWAFEEDLEGDHEPLVNAEGETIRPKVADVPAPRERARGLPGNLKGRATPKSASGEGEQLRINIGSSKGKNRIVDTPLATPKRDVDFDDLESWEDSEGEVEAAKAPAAELVKPAVPEIALVGKMIEAKEPEKELETAEVAAPGNESDDELSPVVPVEPHPLSLRPHLGLTKVERICLISLCALLLVGGVVVWAFSIHKLPTETQKLKARDFPMKGTFLTINSAMSYWREPITDGAEPDTVQKDTKLLPVLEMVVSGGPAVVRVLFRNEERAVIGDVVTRVVRTDGLLVFPATAGFNDLGMHAAYRTGESKPWTIEVYEAQSEEVVSTDYKKLFEIDISTDSH